MNHLCSGVRQSGETSSFSCILKKAIAFGVAIAAMLSFGAVQAQAQAADELQAQVEAQHGQGSLQGIAKGTASNLRVIPLLPKHGEDKTGRPSALSAPAGAHLTYFGGPVISAVQVVIVVYGSGSYDSHIGVTTTPSMSSFFNQLVTGGFADFLNSEYHTTNQSIAHGTVLGIYTIAPSAANNGSTITDAQIQSELQAQITAGHLPAPTYDAGGNVNTIYMTYFPHGKTISQGGSNSCQAGGFCAYHGTSSNTAHNAGFLYGVMPDMQAGSGCDTGCGSASSAFGNYTSVTSHELAEAITDADVGIATASAAPLAWYDSTNGEIGDICNAQQGTFVGSDGQTYTFQLEFSNAQSNCIGFLGASGGTTPDFSISASAVSIVAGSAGSSSVTTSLVGASGTISLALSGVPTGVTASVSPNPVVAGIGATVSIFVASTVAAGSYSITVTGTEGTKIHAATVALTVTASGGGGGGTITNGGFETGNLSGWTAAGAIEGISTTAHTGNYSAQMGSTSPTNGDSSITQTFTAPTGATAVSFWYKMTCPDTVTYDWATATLKDNTAGTTATPLAKTCATSASWINVTSPLTAGHSYTLTLTSHDDNYAGDPSYTLYDDITITTGGGGGGGTGVTNGGFESASTGWTLAGASETIATTGCRTGVGCAKDGLSTPTNGDSTFAQTFTVPAGKTQLSLWYEMTCPDSVTYDWATVTLKNNTANTTATLLPKTCATNAAWVNLTGAVTAGSSYTVTLTSHDDNYASDPSFTLYDDVVLQ